MNILGRSLQLARMCHIGTLCILLVGCDSPTAPAVFSEGGFAVTFEGPGPNQRYESSLSDNQVIVAYVEKFQSYTITAIVTKDSLDPGFREGIDEDAVAAGSTYIYWADTYNIRIRLSAQRDLPVHLSVAGDPEVVDTQRAVLIYSEVDNSAIRSSPSFDSSQARILEAAEVNGQIRVLRGEPERVRGQLDFVARMTDGTERTVAATYDLAVDIRD